jgi:hypothetical protein
LREVNVLDLQIKENIKMKSSATCICSNAEWGCYPFIESIKSFLPAVDEAVVVYNPYAIDDTNKILKREFKNKVRMVPSYFNLEDESVSWLSYAIARTTGYQACTGDIVMVFDIDGILHENDVPRVRELAKNMYGEKLISAYWLKHRIYSRDLIYSQGKHGTIVNKSIAKDKISWYNSDRKGIVTWEEGFDIGKTKQWDVKLFGYEHIWDTEEVVRRKAVRYGHMIDKIYHKGFKTDDEYIKEYFFDFQNSRKPKVVLKPEDHPAIIQDKLKNLTDKHFGFNWFGK